jgi:DNA-binding beta-propeller fold protein YncE
MNAGHNEYFVREVNVQSGARVRSIDLRPSFNFSSVATDDHNVLYVNTKSLVGGDVELFRPEDRAPYLKIKDLLTPLTISVARSSLWVGYQGALADGLARYRLRSTDQTWFKGVATYVPIHVAVNPEGTLVAAVVKRNGKTNVSVYDVKSSNWKQIHEGDTRALASDDSGNLYIAQRTSRILICTFRECPHSFETNLKITALALSPLDGMLYVAGEDTPGKPPGVYVYNPKTTSLIRYLPTGKTPPHHIAIEP